MANILASGQEYLKWILQLQNQLGGAIRPIDLSESMGYSRPSVSIALKKLEKNNFITRDENGYLHLTSEGLAIACNMHERHQVLTNILVKIGVDYEVAKGDACKLEHILSEESYQRLKRCTILYESR